MGVTNQCLSRVKSHNMKWNPYLVLLESPNQANDSSVKLLLKKKEYSDRYAFEIEGLKQSLVDRLPSLRKQLEEQEEIRKTNAIEAARLEEERKRKEAEERQKAELERKRKEEEARAKAEAEKATAEVQAAFDFSAASMSPTPTKAKIKKKIQVTNHKDHAGIPDVVHA